MKDRGKLVCPDQVFWKERGASPLLRLIIPSALLVIQGSFAAGEVYYSSNTNGTGIEHRHGSHHFRGHKYRQPFPPDGENQTHFRHSDHRESTSKEESIGKACLQNDIVFISGHKAGTFLMHRMASSIRNIYCVQDFMRLNSAGFPERVNSEVPINNFVQWNRHRNFSVFISLGYGDLNPNIKWLRDGFKAVLVERHPLDLVVSANRYHRKADEPWLLDEHLHFGNQSYQEMLKNLNNSDGMLLEMTCMTFSTILEMNKAVRILHRTCSRTRLPITTKLLDIAGIRSVAGGGGGGGGADDTDRTQLSISHRSPTLFVNCSAPASDRDKSGSSGGGLVEDETEDQQLVGTADRNYSVLILRAEDLKADFNAQLYAVSRHLLFDSSCENPFRHDSDAHLDQQPDDSFVAERGGSYANDSEHLNHRRFNAAMYATFAEAMSNGAYENFVKSRHSSFANAEEALRNREQQLLRMHHDSDTSSLSAVGGGEGGEMGTDGSEAERVVSAVGNASPVLATFEFPVWMQCVHYRHFEHIFGGAAFFSRYLDYADSVAPYETWRDRACSSDAAAAAAEFPGESSTNQGDIEGNGEHKFEVSSSRKDQQDQVKEKDLREYVRRDCDCSGISDSGIGEYRFGFAGCFSYAALFDLEEGYFSF